MYAKKSYGQHFLNRLEIAEDIANGLTRTDETQRVLEVGPGQGMLTQFLLKKDYQLVAVEADKDMVDVLEKKFSKLVSFKTAETTAKNRILFEDFMKVDLATVFDNQTFCLIGNFPYNISSQILFKMIDNRTLIPEMVGMFQLEVADRVIAKPGGKEFGILSLLIQAFYDCKKLFNVDKSCLLSEIKASK